MVAFRVLSRTNLAERTFFTSSISFTSFRLRTLKLSCRSFSDSRPLFSITSALFSQNTRGGIPLRDLVRCTEAQKRLFVSPLLATLTHYSSRKSFPCHSYANTRDGGVTIAPVSASVSLCLDGNPFLSSFKPPVSSPQNHNHPHCPGGGGAHSRSSLKPPVSSLQRSRGLPAIHYQDVAGDKIRSIRSKKNGGAFQVLLVAEALQRNLAQERVFVSLDHHLRHVRRKPARRDGVHLNIMLAPFARQVFGENDYAAFAGVIPDGLKFRRRAAEPRNGSDVDNFSAPLRDHGFANGLRKQKCPGQIRLNDSVPVLQLHFFHRRTPRNAGVVNQDVDAPKRRERGIHHCMNVRGILDVASQRQRFHAQRLQFFGGLHAALFLPCAKHHVRAHLRQRFRHLPSEAHRAAAYNGHAALNIEKLAHSFGSRRVGHKHSSSTRVSIMWTSNKVKREYAGDRPAAVTHDRKQQNRRSLEIPRRDQAFLRQRPQQSAFLGLGQSALALQGLHHSGGVAVGARVAPDRRRRAFCSRREHPRGG